jgi:CubicO group peptidase (beta-lactamase class C family)
MKNKITCILISILFVSLIILPGIGCKKVLSEPIIIPEPSYWPTQGWKEATPESQGFNSDKLANTLNAIKNKGINIHSLMIVRNGSVILDSYFYPYDGLNYHDVASVTKSIMTTLIGIAADQGKLSLDDPILSFFPERKISNIDTMKKQVTVRHLVSNSSGFRFNEKDDDATIRGMTGTDDWIQAALNPPVTHKPGTHFAYYSPGMHLLSAILQKATGMTALEFAKANLFIPLGIKEVYWPSDPQGYTIGYGDLCLFPADMAKIGFLFLNQGKWEGKQIVSSKWVTEATKKHFDTGLNYEDDYGYGWWISSPYKKFPFYRAYGRKEQIIMVVPSINTLIITTGADFDINKIVKYVFSSIEDLDKPLEPNPSAVEKLNNIVSEIAKYPEPKEVLSLPEIAGKISGKTFIFEPNALTVESLAVNFDNTKKAIFELKIKNEPLPRNIVVGLDGLWKSSVSGKAAVSRGYWKDEKNFILEYSEGPGLNNYSFNLYFENNKVSFKALEPSSVKDLIIEGKSN